MSLELEGKNCLLYKHLDLIAKRWTIFILLEFSKSPKEELRYSQIKNVLGTITPKILSNRLHILVNEGFLKKRETIENNQTQSYYSITPETYELLPILKELKQWGDKYGQECIAKAQCNRCEFL